MIQSFSLFSAYEFVLAFAYQVVFFGLVCKSVQCALTLPALRYLNKLFSALDLLQLQLSDVVNFFEKGRRKTAAKKMALPNSQCFLSQKFNTHFLWKSSLSYCLFSSKWLEQNLGG